MDEFHGFDEYGFGSEEYARVQKELISNFVMHFYLMNARMREEKYPFPGQPMFHYWELYQTMRESASLLES